MIDPSLFPRGSPLGDKIPSEELLPLVYDELRHLAAGRMTAYGPAATLQPTALVHDRCWHDKAHFFRTAAKAMRGILVDRARKKTALKRSDRLAELPIDDLEICAAQPEERLLMIDDVLDRLEQQDEASARIVTLKFLALRRQCMTGMYSPDQKTPRNPA
jgi:RNA polymerase sigma factor (TIGR02999 family)